jgi:hypothetical protein
VPLGLVDALGDARSTLRARYGEKVELVLVAEKKGSLVARLLRRATPGGLDAGGVAGEVLGAIEARAAFARYGL